MRFPRRSTGSSPSSTTDVRRFASPCSPTSLTVTSRSSQGDAAAGLAARRGRRAGSVQCERARGRSTPACSRSVSDRAGRWTRMRVTSRRPHDDSATRWRPRPGPARRRSSRLPASHFEALHPRWLESSHRLGTAYLHGRPGTPGYPEFDVAFETLRAMPMVRTDPGHPRRDVRARRLGGRRARARVPHSHRHRSRELRSRRHSATRGGAKHARSSGGRFVVGSFQKDGVGWETASAEADQGPRRACRGAGTGSRRRIRARRSSDRPSTRLRPQELDRLGIPYRHLLAHTVSSLRVRTTRSTCVSLPHDRREGQRPCSRRWPPAFRS